MVIKTVAPKDSRPHSKYVTGAPFKGNSSLLDSELGPSPSEVAAARMAEKKYPLDDNQSSVPDGVWMKAWKGLGPNWKYGVQMFRHRMIVVTTPRVAIKHLLSMLAGTPMVGLACALEIYMGTNVSAFVVSHHEKSSAHQIS